MKGLRRYQKVWSKHFKQLRSLNFGTGGDRTQHVLWRIQNGEVPSCLKAVVIHCGTNNLDKDSPTEIKEGIVSIVYSILEERPNANIIVTGLLPRDNGILHQLKQIQRVNEQLEKWCKRVKVKKSEILKTRQ